MFGEDRHKTDLKHECELTIDDDVTYQFIDHGLFVTLRRWLRKRMLINEFNPRVRSFYKSDFIITREKLFHLNYHYYMIHPFSTFRELWELLQILSIITQLTVTPLLILKYSVSLIIISVIADIFTFFDIILSFNTGYVHKGVNAVVLTKRMVAKHYLLTTFILDVASFINAHYILHDTYNKYMEFIGVARWMRFVVMLIYLNRLKESRQMNMVVIGVIKLLLAVFFLILWMTALICTAWFSYDSSDFATFTADEVLLGAHEAFCMLFQFGPTDHPKDMGVLLSQGVCLLVGFILHLFLLCYMMQSGARYNSTRKYNQSVKQLTDYMRYKSLPPELQSKILKYYDFRYENNYYRENRIMKLLGPQLQQEVLLQVHMHFFSKFALFELVPLHLLFDIIKRMKVMCYMPSDLIVSPGIRNTSVFFINYGSVAIYTISGKELRHLVEGEHFGELALMGDTRYSSDSIVAIDCCEIYVLRRKHLLEELQPHADVHAKVTKYMSDFITNYYYEDTVIYEDVRSATSKLTTLHT